jgi:uroporphyrinogen-III synthase
MGRKVLIPRPEPGAARTAERLEALGFEPVRLPLTEIHAVLAELPSDRAFDAVAVSSANALRHADRSLLRAIAGLPVFAVGRQTAQAATEAGLDAPIAGPGDGKGLASLMAGRLAHGGRVAYLCGRVRSRGFEEALFATGIEAMPVETYDTVMLDYEDAELSTALGSEAFDAVLLYSRMAAGAFAALAGRSILSPLLARSALICMSERVAEPLASGRRTLVAAAPDEEAMLALLAG